MTGLDWAAAALLFTDARFPWVGPTAEEAEVAAVLSEVAELHGAGCDVPDGQGRFGRCVGCADWWPCPAWTFGEQLAVQFLGRAAARVFAHATSTIERNRRSA